MLLFIFRVTFSVFPTMAPTTRENILFRFLFFFLSLLVDWTHTQRLISHKSSLRKLPFELWKTRTINGIRVCIVCIHGPNRKSMRRRIEKWILRTDLLHLYFAISFSLLRDQFGLGSSARGRHLKTRFHNEHTSESYYNFFILIHIHTPPKPRHTHLVRTSTNTSGKNENNNFFVRDSFCSSPEHRMVFGGWSAFHPKSDCVTLTLYIDNVMILLS